MTFVRMGCENGWGRALYERKIVVPCCLRLQVWCDSVKCLSAVLAQFAVDRLGL